MKTGLILEGGAMRGLFTAGVIDVMMENGIDFEAVIGVSAGAAFGANYKSRQTGRVLRYNLRFARDRRYCSIYSLLKTGDLYGGEFCYHTLPCKLDIMDKETFDADPQKFYVVCTDAETGEPIYHCCETLDRETLEWVRASASMPGAARPVEIDGRKLLDGGISDSVPVDFFLQLGCAKPVVVLTQPKGYRKKPMRSLAFLKPLIGPYPAVFEQLKKRHVSYNAVMEKIDGMEASGALFVIRPAAPIQTGKTEHDPKVIQSVYDSGRERCSALLNDLKKYLSEPVS